MPNRNCTSRPTHLTLSKHALKIIPLLEGLLIPMQELQRVFQAFATGCGASFFELLPYCLNASIHLWQDSHAFDLRECRH